MRVGLLSDTHGNLKIARAALQQMGRIQMFLHAGDYHEDVAKLALMPELATVEVHSVVGNCDYRVRGPKEKVLTAEGRRILLTHGHQYDVKRTLDRLFYRAKEARVDVVVYGHTHVAGFFAEDSILFINPGSPYLPRGRDVGSCAVLDITSKGIVPQIVTVK
ncbi:MAG: metallophosphoesterase [Actinobacteria bacterium]|nr:metallophosphoesterase [Actinomycetota bacterium]